MFQVLLNILGKKEIYFLYLLIKKREVFVDGIGEISWYEEWQLKEV